MLKTTARAPSVPENLLSTSMASTSCCEYPCIAVEKYRAALERVANVHARFQKEVDSIVEGITGQSALSVAANESFRDVGPCLGDIARNIRSMGEDIRSVGQLVAEGREGLVSSVSDARTAMEQLRERNLAMRGILEMSREVTEGVGKIAEIAVENNLIAINASITASKVSDNVKGFKVIASEITRISAAMAERVGLIVDRATLVDGRVQQVIRNMDESIQSTQKALAQIDEAFSLLDHIETTLGEAGKADANMLEENDLLSKNAGLLGEALSAIRVNAEEAGRQAEAIQEAMRRQAGNIEGLGVLLPEAEREAVAIAEVAAETSAVAARPKVLRLNEAALTTYDPALTRMLREMHYMTFVCIRLLRYSTDRKLVPYLAETWFLRPDGLTWEFQLKDNVSFLDGSPVSSKDVKFSLERLMNPALASPYANLFSIIEGAEEYRAGKAASVSGIVLDGPLHLQITLKRSFNSFLSLLALSFSAILKENRAIFSRPIGRDELLSAGPFGFAPSDDPTVDRLVRNDGFVNGRPFLDGLEIRRGQIDVVEALARGELDLAYNLPAAAADLLTGRNFKGEPRYYTSRYCYGLVVNYTRRNFLSRNAELRRAVAMAIDKDGIVRDLLGGKAVRADAVLPQEQLDLGGRRFIPYDPEGAASIVQGYRSREDLGEAIAIAYRGYATIPAIQAIAERITRDIERLGLKVRVSFHPAATPIAAFKDDYDLVFLGFMSELDLYSAIEPFINPEGGDNYFKYDNPGLFTLLNDSLGIKDGKERESCFIGILEKLTRDVFSIPLFFNKAIAAIPSGVHSVFMTAEECFVPDVVFLSEGVASSPAGLRPSSGGYAATVKKLGDETAVIAGASRGLIGTGRDIGRQIALQRDSVRESDALFSSFAESAAGVQATRAAIVESIRSATEAAGKSGSAATLIRAGLDGLSTALEAAVRTLNQAGKDVRDMLSIVGRHKRVQFVHRFDSDQRGGDIGPRRARAEATLSWSLGPSRSRRSGTRPTPRRSGAALEAMGKAVGGHSAFLAALMAAIDKAGKSAVKNGRCPGQRAPPPRPG